MENRPLKIKHFFAQNLVRITSLLSTQIPMKTHWRKHTDMCKIIYIDFSYGDIVFPMKNTFGWMVSLDKVIEYGTTKSLYLQLSSFFIRKKSLFGVIFVLMAFWVRIAFTQAVNSGHYLDLLTTKSFPISTATTRSNTPSFITAKPLHIQQKLCTCSEVTMTIVSLQEISQIALAMN